MAEGGQGSQARLLEWGDLLVFFLFPVCQAVRTEA
jgi:hypothetical protein